tara:strand:- start:171 stop:392 length:222 start_codon:yes stop_codon:yes gene_type:complete
MEVVVRVVVLPVVAAVEVVPELLVMVRQDLVAVRVVVVVTVVVQEQVVLDYKTILELALTSGMQVEEAVEVVT